MNTSIAPATQDIPLCGSGEGVISVLGSEEAMIQNGDVSRDRFIGLDENLEGGVGVTVSGTEAGLLDPALGEATIVGNLSLRDSIFGVVADRSAAEVGEEVETEKELLVVHEGSVEVNPALSQIRGVEGGVECRSILKPVENDVSDGEITLPVSAFVVGGQPE